MRRIPARLAVPLAAIGLATAHPARSQSTPPAPASRCAAPAFHQFDFFIGEWDTYDMSDTTKVIARNHVVPMVDGCAVREQYSQNDGMRGESFSAWDPGRKVWHQSWVTNHGSMLLMNGGLEHGRMTFTGVQHPVGAPPSRFRVSWWRDGNGVREKADQTTDGKTWTSMFDIVFKPRRTTVR